MNIFVDKATVNKKLVSAPQRLHLGMRAGGYFIIISHYFMASLNLVKINFQNRRPWEWASVTNTLNSNNDRLSAKWTMVQLPTKLPKYIFRERIICDVD